MVLSRRGDTAPVTVPAPWPTGNQGHGFQNFYHRELTGRARKRGHKVLEFEQGGSGSVLPGPPKQVVVQEWKEEGWRYEG